MSDITTDWPAMADDDGTLTVGTIVNKALFDSIKTAINNQVKSATNPTLTPEDIIDEVVTARGNLASLTARIGGVIDANGNLIAPSSLITAAQGKSIVGTRDVALNGSLEDWAAGGAAAPDDWVLSGAGAAVARTGAAMADTFTFGAGPYAAKLTRAGADVRLTQTVIGTSDWAANESIEADKFSVGFFAKSSIANHIRITVSDGATTTSSSYHTGGGTTEYLTVTHTISSSATKLEVYVEVNSSNGDAYAGGFTFAFADIPPNKWSPLSSFFVATATRKGLLSIADQVFVGVKSFNSHPQFEPGTSTGSYAPMSGVLNVNVTAVGNVGAGEDNLMSYALPANVLSANGKLIRITAMGDFLTSANTKRLRIKFGATTIYDSTAKYNDSTNRTWCAQFYVVRTGASAELAWGQVTIYDDANDTISAASDVMTGEPSTPAGDTTTALTIQFTGEATADNEVVQRFLMVEVLN